MKAAIRDPNPVVFLEHELLYGELGAVPDYDDFVLPIGRAHRAPGADVTLVAYARGVNMRCKRQSNWPLLAWTRK